MKIGILTFWWSNENYGQILQAYALQKYLRDIGHDAFLIRYDARKEKIPKNPLYLKLLKAMNPITLTKFLVLKIKSKNKNERFQKEQLEHPRNIEDFREKYLHLDTIEYNAYSDLKDYPPEADCYIVGSDQVWNFWPQKAFQAKNLIHAYFLDFGDKNTKRISYAASWGSKSVSNDKRSEITPLLAQFNLVTVREKSGVEVCKICGNENAMWVCDPTLLLDAETYRELYKSELSTDISVSKDKQSKSYLLFYFLDNGGDFNKESVFIFAREKGLDVEYVSGNWCVDSYNKNFANVSEWLALIDGAEYVVTDSFHCCVFSVLFKKKFGAIKLSGRNSGMNERLESLFEMTGCGERYVKDDDFSILDKNYSASNDFQLKIKSRELLNSLDVLF